MKNASLNIQSVLNNNDYLNTYLAQNLILLFENYLKQNKKQFFEIAQKEFAAFLKHAVENRKNSIDDFPQWLEFKFVDFTKDYFVKKQSEIKTDPATNLRYCFIENGAAIAKELRQLKSAIVDFERGLFSLLIFGGNLSESALNTDLMRGTAQKSVDNIHKILVSIADKNALLADSCNVKKKGDQNA